MFRATSGEDPEHAPEADRSKRRGLSGIKLTRLKRHKSAEPPQPTEEKKPEPQQARTPAITCGICLGAAVVPTTMCHSHPACYVCAIQVAFDQVQNGKPYECPTCRRDTSRFQSALLINGQLKETVRWVLPLPAATALTVPGPYLCPFECGEVFAELAALVSHLGLCPDRLTACLECPAQPRDKDREMHLRVHEKEALLASVLSSALLSWPSDATPEETQAYIAFLETLEPVAKQGVPVTLLDLARMLGEQTSKRAFEPLKALQKRDYHRRAEAQAGQAEEAQEAEEHARREQARLDRERDLGADAYDDAWEFDADVP